MKTYSVGSMVVSGNLGLGSVKRIDRREIGGKAKEFYVVAFRDGMTAMFPVDSPDLRAPVSEAGAAVIFKLLGKRGEIEQTTWNRRYREYMEKIKSGSLSAVAEVYRNLRQLREDKDLSFGERKMLDQAQGLLVDELCVALGESEDAVTAKVLSATGGAL